MPSKRCETNARYGGEYVYWEPILGFAVRVYLKGNIDSALMHGVPIGTRALETMDTDEYSKALVENRVLASSLPANPYSMFIKQVAGQGSWSLAAHAKPDRLGRLGRMYKACWDLAQSILAKRLYAGKYRDQRLVNMCDLCAVVEAVCDNWRALKLQDLNEMQAVYDAGVTAEDWFTSWKNYTTARSYITVGTIRASRLYLLEDSIRDFVSKWRDSGDSEPARDIQDEPADDKRDSVVLINDASATELMCGKKEHHSINMYSQMTYVLWFDVPQSLLSTCATVLGLDKLPYFDKVSIEDNRIVITAEFTMGESYPSVDGIRDDRLKQLCAKVDSVYNDVVALSHSLAQAQGKYAESWTKAETC